MNGKEVNRRTFLKVAAAGIGAIGMTGLQAAEARIVNLPQVPKWDEAADVVVIGYGAAGGSAAVAAHDAGAGVLILEKMSVAGGNSGVCLGGMAIPGTVEAASEYYRKLSFGTVDEEMLQGFAEAMVGVPDLLTGLGGYFKMGKHPPAFPALRYSDLPSFRFAPTGQKGFQFLAGLVEKRKIRVFLNTSARNLVKIPETGEIAGVKAVKEAKTIYIKAAQGVVLSCGGYENNPEMFGYWNFPGLRDFVFPYGNPGNTGDGLKISSAAGAQLWHTAALQWGGFCAKAPSRQFGVAVGAGIPRIRDARNFIFVNKYGNRFMKETIGKYNGYCAAGEDLQFDRAKNSMAPIEKPPYYALEMGLVLVNTQGGPKHNRFGQVLDTDDKPIPRLYAAGELGSFFGFLYQEGSNYPEAWACGRIAGKQAAAEKPLKE